MSRMPQRNRQLRMEGKMEQRYINLKGTDEDVFLLRDGKKIPYSEVLLQTDSADDSEDLPF